MNNNENKKNKTEKKYPDKEDVFDSGQGKREKETIDDENSIVVKPSNPDSQEWHARESVSKEEGSHYREGS